METRKPTTVVYVVNFVNDLFENERPNKNRHAIWDGWAVRKETAPNSTISFPGRKWLFSQSHLFYAYRRWRYSNGPKRDDRGFESEGTWTDIVSIGQATKDTHALKRTAVDKSNAAQSERVAEVQKKITMNETEVEEILLKYIEDDPKSGFQETNNNYLRLRSARGKPGDIVDIVSQRNVEAGRSTALTGRAIRKGVLFRNKLAAKARTKDETLAKLLQNKDVLVSELGLLNARSIEIVTVPSVLEKRLREVKALCDAHDAELVVVALPIDVQVSNSEWNKYSVKNPPDMLPTRVLLHDLVTTTEAMGSRAVDVTDALAKVDAPFLNHDIHMTPAGHKAVAEALANKLLEPEPFKMPIPGLPLGRTRIPDPATWRTMPEATVHGSSKAKCETTEIAEWFRATCLKFPKLAPIDIVITSGGHGEASVIHTKESVTLVTPLFEDEEFTATFYWKTHTQNFTAQWPKGRVRALMWFDERVELRSEFTISKDEERLCECHLEVEKEAKCKVVDGWPTRTCRSTCVNLYGQASSECMETYKDNCKALLACIRGEPTSLPTCAPGYANVGAVGQCSALCSPKRPCKTGECLPWQGTSVCR